MPAPFLGAHMKKSKGLGNAVREGHAIGCTAIQVFTSNPQQWKSSPVTPELVADFREAREATGLRQVVSHDSYLVNLCAAEPEIQQKSIVGLRDELLRCHLFGIPYVVSHMGSHKGCGEAQGMQEVAAATLDILDETPDDVMLLMETTAGQGSSLNYRFEQLARLVELLNGHPRVGICLDTCHVFVAGYDIRTEEGYTKTFAEFDRLVGIPLLKVIHANDSKKGLGSNVDRHANIGEGEIGETAFRLLMNDPRLEHIPVILETPDAPEGHVRDLELLRSFVRDSTHG